MRTIMIVVAAVGVVAALGIAWSNVVLMAPVVSHDPVSAVAQVPPDALDSVAESFASYEKIRSHLAEDKLEGVSKEAERLAKFSERAADRAQETLKARFEAAAKAAGKVQAAKDLAQARLGFGEISREFVEILRADPTLARGRYVYRCPMVKKGYALWVQTEKAVSNPYMGKAMVTCGVDALKD